MKFKSSYRVRIPVRSLRFCNQGSCLYPVLASPLCGRYGESALVSIKEPHAARYSLDKPPWAYLTYTDKIHYG